MYVKKHFEVGVLTLINVCLQNNFICYAFEDHINVGRDACWAALA